MFERRQFERFMLPLAAVVNYEVDGRQLSEKTQLSNISIGGTLLRLAGRPADGTELNLSIVDDQHHLANALSMKAAADKPLHIGVFGTILRSHRGPGRKDTRFYAVKFLSPLRIVNGAAFFA